MAFTQSKSSLKQTAFNVAGTIVAALANAGIVTDPQEAMTQLTEFKDAVFKDLSDEFEAEPATAAPARTNGSTSGGRSGGYDPNIVTFGKYKGQTLDQIAESGDTDYIGWLAKNANFDDTRKAANDWLDNRRASV